MKLLSVLILPFFVFGTLLFAWAKKINTFSVFTRGAKNGAQTIIDIIPSLIGLFVAIGVFRASGAMDLVTEFLAPLGKILGIDKPLLPLVIMRPVSGSASLALVKSIIDGSGADTYIGRAAAVMMGSTETIFYTLAVYMGGSGIKKAKGVLPAALAANLVSALIACMLCK